MFIVRPDLEETIIKGIVKDLEEILTKEKVKIISFKEMGQRKLAYEIKKHHSGYYYLYEVEAEAQAIKEFDRLIRINENVIRYIIINLDN